MNAQNNTTNVLQCQPDWLTITAKEQPARSDIISLGEALVRQEERAGFLRRGWDWKSYHGEHAGRATFGERADTAILQLTQDLAASYFDSAYTIPVKVTRIDLQVTWKDPQYGTDWARRIYEGGADHDAYRGRSTKRTLVTTLRGGSTVYIGSRRSNGFGRCYDKAMESGERQYTGCWRWEVECKGELAGYVARSLYLAKNRAEFVAAYVRSWFTERGGYCPWSTEAIPTRPPPVPVVTDIDRRLSWLQKQVSPSVEWLIEKGELGRLLSALGLDSSVAVSTIPLPDDGSGQHSGSIAAS